MATYSFLDVNATLVGAGAVIDLGAGSANAEEGISTSMADDKNTMTIEFTVIDPVFLQAPFTWKKQYKVSDQEMVDRWDCDPGATYPEVFQTARPRYADDTEWLKYNPK